MNRIPIRVAALSAAVLLLAACGGTDDAESSAASADPTTSEQSGAPSGEPVSIGYIVTLSGGLAEIGLSHQAGAQLAEKMINESGGVLGRPIKAEFKD
jgi:ABC-type branched-subunit amino acid transport system substrate-binding protein